MSATLTGRLGGAPVANGVATMLGIPSELEQLDRAVNLLDKATQELIERTNPLVVSAPCPPSGKAPEVTEAARSAVAQQIRQQRKRVEDLTAVINARICELEV